MTVAHDPSSRFKQKIGQYPSRDGTESSKSPATGAERKCIRVARWHSIAFRELGVEVAAPSPNSVVVGYPMTLIVNDAPVGRAVQDPGPTIIYEDSTSPSLLQDKSD